MINPNGGFIAEIRNINDPYQSGRYQVRVYGNHNNEQTIQDQDLKWAQFLQHAGSAATSKIGMLPTGPIVGSRVYGTYLDAAKQYPIILGVFPRGANLSDPSNADVGQDGLDSQSYGIDCPIVNGTANGNFGLAPNAPGLGGTAVNPTSAQFNQAPTIPNNQGQQGLNTARQMHAPNADQPTIAAVTPSTNLPAALQQVGSNAQVLPMMVNLLSEVQSMMTMNDDSNSDDSSTVPPASANLTGIPASLGLAFGKVLVRIAYHLGFDYVINVLAETFSYSYGHYYNLDIKYQAPVVQGILYLISNFATYKQEESFIPPANILANTVSNTNLSNTYIITANVVSTYTTANVILVSNPPNLPYPLVSSVPNYYIQRYYIYQQDPYPGYIQWLGPNGSYLFTIRTTNDPNYSSSTDGISGLMKIQMYDILYPYFEQGFVRAAYINAALNVIYENAQNYATDSILGNNSSSSDSSILASAIAILGPIGSIIMSANTQHIPNSVFNQSSMTMSLQNFTQNIGTLQQMKNVSNTAFNPIGILGQLSSLFSSSDFAISSTGTLTSNTISYMSSSGISSDCTTSLNNIVANSGITSSNTISTIASVTSSLQQANASSRTIQDVQILLSEILVSNVAVNIITYGNNYLTVNVSSNNVGNNVIISNNSTNNIIISNTTTNTIVNTSSNNVSANLSPLAENSQEQPLSYLLIL